MPAIEVIDAQARHRAHREYACAIAQTLSERKVDLVHMHGVDFAQYLPPSGVPVLVTVHLPIEYYDQSAFRPRRGMVFNAVSEWQQQQCGTWPRIELVVNGVDTAAFVPTAGKDEFVLALGRVCPEKGFHLALELAALADMNCLLAGQVYGYADHRRYFANEIAPRLDHRRRFIGKVGGAFKRRLLSAAKCLLIPSLVAETSSLVAMEALACGTPVVAFRTGALAEIVTHQKTGFVVSDAEEMAEAIRSLDFIDRRTCRREACLRFSATQMVANYLRLYESIIEENTQPDGL